MSRDRRRKRLHNNITSENGMQHLHAMLTQCSCTNFPQCFPQGLSSGTAPTLPSRNIGSCSLHNLAQEALVFLNFLNLKPFLIFLNLRCRSSSKPIKRWMLKFGISDLVLLSNQVSLQCPATMPVNNPSYNFWFGFRLLTVFRFSCIYFCLFCVKVAHCSPIYGAGGFKPEFDSFDFGMDSDLFRFLTVFNIRPKVFQFSCIYFFLFCVKVAHGSPI